MRIQNDSINKMLGIYKSHANVGKTNKAEKSKKSDQLNISNTGRDFQIAMEQVKNQPEIREEKVENIKKQIQAGTYNVDAKKIAEKMMTDANMYKKL